MSADYIIEQQEQECREENERHFIREVAIHVIKGMARNSAIEHVKQINYLRSEAELKNHVIRNVEGHVTGYLESGLMYPDTNNIKESQIYAIYLELCDSEGISPE